MALKYTDKVQLNRQREIDEYRETILHILENSRQLVTECDNLVKLRALKTRCEKIAKPRAGPSHDERRVYKKQRYEQNREDINARQRDKRKKIRDLSQADVFRDGITA